MAGNDCHEALSSGQLPRVPRPGVLRDARRCQVEKLCRDRLGPQHCKHRFGRCCGDRRRQLGRSEGGQLWVPSARAGSNRAVPPPEETKRGRREAKGSEPRRLHHSSASTQSSRGVRAKQGAYTTCTWDECAASTKPGPSHCGKPDGGGKKKPCSVAGCTTAPKTQGSLLKTRRRSRRIRVWRLHQPDDGNHVAYLPNARRQRVRMPDVCTHVGWEL